MLNENVEKAFRAHMAMEHALELVEREGHGDAELEAVKVVLEGKAEAAEAVYLDALIAEEGDRQRELAGSTR